MCANAFASMTNVSRCGLVGINDLYFVE